MPSYTLTNGNDTFVAYDIDNVVHGLGGNDLIITRLTGPTSFDSLLGGSGNDRLEAGGGNDYLYG